MLYQGKTQNNIVKVKFTTII